jgi:hypothetical protein
MSVKASVLDGRNGREASVCEGSDVRGKRVYTRTSTGAQACLWEDRDGRESE